MLGTLFFDKQDRELLRMINETIDHGPSQDLEHKVFDANLHPHGILELTTTHEYRMAHAVINLLGNLEAGGAPDRLMALRILRDEVLHSARTPFRYNTGRVLIQIMKEIIRSRQDELTQLKLVHDFRKVTSGNPRLVRQFLNTYHLLEMPEEWNQLTVDHHVHDANTKGRKNATHLIMDAWIKGIRYITVVYYNYVEPAAARELLQAAEIMGVDVRIGLEFRTPFRDRFVCFVWAPRGFSDPEAFLSFLAERPMVALMNEGRKASLWMQRHVMDTLQLWNAKHAPALAEELEIYRDIELVRLTKCPLHICHISTRKGLDLVRAAKADGLPVTCEVTPHHLFLCEDDITDAYDTNLKMNPPLRTADDAAALREGLLDGSIDCVVTDHAPHAPHEKDCEWEISFFGIVGLETSLPLMLQNLVATGKMSWSRLVEVMAVNPRRLLRLDPVCVKAGSAADLTLIDPAKSVTVTPEWMQSRSKNSAWLGQTLTGVATDVFVSGKRTLADGVVTPQH